MTETLVVTNLAPDKTTDTVGQNEKLKYTRPIWERPKPLDKPKNEIQKELDQQMTPDEQKRLTVLIGRLLNLELTDSKLKEMFEGNVPDGVTALIEQMAAMSDDLGVTDNVNNPNLRSVRPNSKGEAGRKSVELAYRDATELPRATSLKETQLLGNMELRITVFEPRRIRPENESHARDVLYAGQALHGRRPEDLVATFVDDTQNTTVVISLGKAAEGKSGTLCSVIGSVACDMTEKGDVVVEDFVLGSRYVPDVQPQIKI